MKLLLKSALVIIIGLGCWVVFSGFKVNPLYFFWLLFVVPSGIVTYEALRRLLRQQRIDGLRNEWGKEKARQRDYSRIESLFRHTNSVQEDESIAIDDHTWSDLNMNEVYSKIDRTLTCPGESVLYRILRTPRLSDVVLKDRSVTAELLQRDGALRESIQLALLRLGRPREGDLVHLLWHQAPGETPFRFLYSFLALVAAISLLSPLVWGWTAIIAIIVPLFLINGLARFMVRLELLSHLAAIRHLGALIRTGKRIASKLKRHRLHRMPFILRHEVNVPLSRPAVQVPDKDRHLVPRQNSERIKSTQFAG